MQFGNVAWTIVSSTWLIPLAMSLPCKYPYLADYDYDDGLIYRSWTPAECQKRNICGSGMTYNIDDTMCSGCCESSTKPASVIKKGYRLDDRAGTMTPGDCCRAGSRWFKISCKCWTKLVPISGKKSISRSPISRKKSISRYPISLKKSISIRRRL